MLKIYDFNNPTNVIPLHLEDDKRYITHKFNGYDTLTFEIESNHKLYKYIAEEVKIEDEKNRYIVKKIDEHSNFVTAVCEVDLDDWKEIIFEAFRTTNKMLSEVLSLIIPDGWTSIGDSLFSLRTTIEESEGKPFYGVNALDILPTIAEVYSCTFQFDAINKTIEIINRPVSNDEANLDDVIFYVVEHDKPFEIDLSQKNSVAGTNYILSFDVRDIGTYRLTLFGSSELGELAQLPCSLFFQGIPTATFVFNGSNGKTVSITKDIACPTRFSTFRLFVSQNGLKLEKLKVEFVGKEYKSFFNI